MLKNKRLNSTLALFAVSTVFAVGFTSRAGTLTPDEKVETVFVNTVEELPKEQIVNIASKATVKEVTSAAVQGIHKEVEKEGKKQEKARKKEEAARRKAEQKKKEEQKQAALKTGSSKVKASSKGAGDVQKLLASIIFCEAGNQSYEGQVAVGAVVMNRVKSGSYPDSVEAVIYQKGQFSPVATGWLDKVRSSGGYTESALKAAKAALNGANPVGNCLYFDQGGNGMKIGDHYFH